MNKVKEEDLNIDFQLNTIPIFGKFYDPLNKRNNFQIQESPIWISNDFELKVEDIKFINKIVQTFWGKGGIGYGKIDFSESENGRRMELIVTGDESLTFLFESDSFKQIIKASANRVSSPRSRTFYFESYIDRMIQIEIIKEALGEILEKEFNLKFPRFLWATSQLAGVEFIDGIYPSNLDFIDKVDAILKDFLTEKSNYNPVLWQGMCPDLDRSSFLVTNSGVIYWIDPLERYGRVFK